MSGRLTMAMRGQERVLRRWSRRLALTLALRLGLRWFTLAFLVAGTVVLVVRILMHLPAHHLIAGLLLLLPLSGAAWIRAVRARPSRAVLCALMDRHNRYGGVLMAGEQVDTGAWGARLAAPVMPEIRWRSQRALTLFAVAAGYLAITLSLPDRLTALRARKPLEVGQLVKELSSQIETLEQEKIMELPQAREVREKLNQLREEASGADPARTWEALDHLRQSASESAQKAAEEALSKLETLSQAETLAASLAMVASSNLNEQVATQAMQELGSLLQNAKIEEGVLAGALPPELLAAMKNNALSPAQMSQLLQAINSGKGRLGESLTNLAELKLIDPELAAKRQGASQGGDPKALAAFLASCAGSDSSGGLANLNQFYGRGGRDRGRGDAPMTWSEGTSEDDAQFKEDILPRQSSDGQQAQLVGVSRATPQLTDARETAGAGALRQAQRGGGAAQAQVVLPRHREAVQRFFQRPN